MDLIPILCGLAIFIVSAYAAESALKRHTVFAAVFYYFETFCEDFVAYRASSKLDDDIAKIVSLSKLTAIVSFLLVCVMNQLQSYTTGFFGLIFLFSFWVFAAFQESFRVGFQKASKTFLLFVVIGFSPWVFAFGMREPFVPEVIMRTAIEFGSHNPWAQEYISDYSILGAISLILLGVGFFISYTGFILHKAPMISIILIIFTVNYISKGIQKYWVGAHNFAAFAKFIALVIFTYTTLDRTGLLA